MMCLSLLYIICFYALANSKERAISQPESGGQETWKAQVITRMEGMDLSG